MSVFRFLLVLLDITIVRVSGFRLKSGYRNSGTPAMSSKTQPVSLDQVCSVLLLSGTQVTSYSVTG